MSSMDLKWDQGSLADSIRVEEADDKVATSYSSVGGPALGSPSTSTSFSVQFQVIRSRDSDGGGMVLGVADAEPAFARGCVAGWGLNLYNGQLNVTEDVFRYDERDVDSVWDTPGRVERKITGCTVTVDVCRIESRMTFSINDGPAIEVPVSGLANSLRPWVLFGFYEGDSVKLISMTERSQLVITVECHWDSTDFHTVTCTNLSGEELATQRITEPTKQTLKGCFPILSGIPIAFVSLVTAAGRKLDASDQDTVLATLFAEEMERRTWSAAND